MSSDSATTGPRYTTRLLLLLGIGAAVSGWLLYHHVTVKTGNLTSPSLCNVSATFNCDDVVQSVYSEFLAIPVASWGLWYYLGLILLILIFAPVPGAPVEQKSRFAAILLFATSLSLPPTLLLFYLSWFHIGTLCLFCTGLYLVNFLLFAVVLTGKERAGTLFGDLREGFFGSFQLLFAGRLASARFPAFKTYGCWAMLLVAAAILIRVPDLLVAHVFEPRKAALLARSAALPAVERWQKVEPEEMGIVYSGSSMQRDIAKGPEDAPLTLVEFVDFQCPACRRAAQQLKPLVDQFPGKVRIVFRNFPLDSNCNSAMKSSHHPYACIAATMARCAGLQSTEAFWKTHDALFDLSFWNDENLFGLPGRLGLDQAAIDTCMGDGAALERVKVDVEHGIRLNLVSTPTVFLNGRRLLHTEIPYLPGMLKLILDEKRY